MTIWHLYCNNYEWDAPCHWGTFATEEGIDKYMKENPCSCNSYWTKEKDELK